MSDTSLPQNDEHFAQQMELMFEHTSKLSKLVSPETITNYKSLYFHMLDLQKKGALPTHASNEYLGDSIFAKEVYETKYYLKGLEGNNIESHPEQVFVRLASYLGSVEKSEEARKEWASKFYEMLFDGSFLPGGRVIAGAGDLFRLKTLANCFVSLIEGDNIESIYKAAYECARTYSFGGGIGVDISILRPKDAVVHNAANNSTGSVSFMELYSLTTGLIGQSGRRGALMLTLDVKHPDALDFIKVKKVPSHGTNQILQQCNMLGTFDDTQLKVIEKQVRENTQVRFANISLKMSDEFMQSVDEQNVYGKESILVYEKHSPEIYMTQPENTQHYSYGMPSKDIEEYTFVKSFSSLEEANSFLQEKGATKINAETFEESSNRDIFGDHVVQTTDGKQLSVRGAGDFMLYFKSEQTGEIKRLVKAREIWDQFVAGNYSTAEPGLIFWSSMAKGSPSNYLDKPIACTNPCGEVPLEDGGACNLGSVNLSRMVLNPYSENAEINWEKIEKVTRVATRFLDNVITWNQTLNALEKQRDAAKSTRRIGLGVMGLADFFNQLGYGYDSDEALGIIEKVLKLIANASYQESALIAKEKGTIPGFDFAKYSKNPFFQSSLTEDTKKMVEQYGIRNIAILSIAPTGTISSVIKGFEREGKNYIGVSGGVEPIFALYYTRRYENLGDKMYNLFHSTVQAFIDMKGLASDAKHMSEEELKTILPSHFFRTSHHVKPGQRVRMQGICQKYIDHSISSTINLPESIDPEVISNVYLDAWKKGLKGVTIYRDGSRYAILTVQQQQSKFQDVKDKKFNVEINGHAQIMRGDEVFNTPQGTLTTPFHAMESNMEGITISPFTEESPIVVEQTAGATSEIKSTKDDDFEDKESSESETTSKDGGACKVKLVDGKLIKECA